MNLGLAKLFRHSGMSLFRQVLAAAVQLLAIVFIARVYGASGLGQFSLAILLPGVLSMVMSLGLPSSFVYFISSGRGSPAALWRITSLPLVLLISVACALGVLVIACFPGSLFPGIEVNFLTAALISLPAIMLGQVVIATFQGQQRFRIYNLLLLLQPAAFLFFLLMLYVTGMKDVGFAVLAYTASHYVALVFYLLVSRASPGPEGAHGSLSAREVLVYGSRNHINNILVSINYRADLFIVNLLAGAKMAGLYSLATQIVERLWMLSQSVNVVLFPRLASLTGQDDQEKTGQITAIVCRWVLYATFLIACVVLVFAELFVGLVFGSEFTAAVLVVAVLMPGVIVGAGSRIIANDLAARGRPELNSWPSIVVVVTNVALNFLLIPEYGIVGAALATSVAYSLNFVLRVSVYVWVTGVPIWQLVLYPRQDIELLRKLIVLLLNRKKGRGV